MKNITKSINWLMPLGLMVIFMTSCINYTDYGQRGEDGRAYFGIDYDFNPPYSYWDDNMSVPQNPYFGEFYRSEPGIYDFEYFINPWEYWWGTYTLYENEGEWGGTNNTPGQPGADTFFLLICNENGFYSETWEDDWYRTAVNENGTVLIEGTDGARFKLEMRKSTVTERPAKGNPKFRKRN